MQVKNASSLAAALEWTSRWRPAGTTNIWKALDLALSNSFADCIYLITDGKPDKPVLVLESLKRLAKQQGRITPIHTVGVGPTKPAERFLQKISRATGGEFRELELEWKSGPIPCGGEDLEDMLWARAMIEARQRRNAVQGKAESVHEIVMKVKEQFEEERHAPRIAAHFLKEKKALVDHQALVQYIRAQNQLVIDRARKAYEQQCSAIAQKNKMMYELAQKHWMQEIQTVRKMNQQNLDMLERWKQTVKAIEESNAQFVANANQQFQKDLKQVEDNNKIKLQHAHDDYNSELKRVRAWNEAAVAERDQKQKEMDSSIAERNQAVRVHYEQTLAAMKEANNKLLEKAHLDYNENLSCTRAEHDRIMKANEMDFNRKCEQVRVKNAMLKEALQKTLESIKQQKEAALAAHQAHVAAAIAEHGVEVKKYAALNIQNEEQTRANWKQSCDIIDEENLAAAKKAVQFYEEEQKHVAKVNKKRAEQRLAFHKRKLEIEQLNEKAIQEKKLKWKEACEVAEKAYEEEVFNARLVHAKLCEEINLRNAEVLQAALLEHKAKETAIEAYNETVRPFVEASNVVKAEVARLYAFLRYLVGKIFPEKDHSSNSRLEADLDSLATSNQPLNTKWIIEGLQVAYGTEVIADKKGDQKSPTADEPKKDLSTFLPISPVRARAHHCGAA